jgi:DNA-binding CsgD family transcriptional regulator
VIVDSSVTARVQAALRPRLQMSNQAFVHHEADWNKASPAARDFFQESSETTVHELLGSSLAALDMLNIGLTICNISGQLLIANKTAEEILSSRDGLELDSDNVLCTTRECNPSLRQLMQEAMRSAMLGKSGESEAMLAIPRTSGKRALTVLVRAATRATAGTHSEQPATLVFIVDSGSPAQAAELELRQLYGLTLTEARLANLLMEGKSLVECGCQLGIRRSTVRMHLRNLFAKTGVSRQGELVSLLLKSIGLGPREKRSRVANRDNFCREKSCAQTASESVRGIKL